MNLLSLLTSGKDYTGIVKQFIEKVFVHEAGKYECKPEDLRVVIARFPDGNMSINTYKTTGQKLRTIPDEEVQNILMK